MNKKIATASYLVAAGLALSSCELLGPQRAAKLPLPPVAKEKPGDQAGVVFEQLQNKPPLTDSMKPHIELYPGTDRSISPLPVPQRKSIPRGAGSYSLNFDDADLGEVAKVILSDILGQNYVLSPKVAGKVTLQTTEALTKEELLPTLEMLLQMNNAALIKDGRIYHIEPATEALYSADVSVSGSGLGRAGYQLKVIPIKNVAAQDIADILKPLVHEKTVLNVNGARNILFASGTADEMARVTDMVNTFDVDVLKGRSFGLFPLVHVSPKDIIDELEAVFNKKTGGEEESDFFRFIEIERLNAVLAITHQARYLKDIENWVIRLDRANTATGGGVNVYKVQHADAEELADTLNEIFTGAAAKKKEKKAKVAPGQNAAEASNKPAADKSASKKSSAGTTGDATVSNVENVRIIADKANNAIVTVATPREYETILPVIKELDILPLQVLIDASVVSVTLTDKLQYGIEWFLRQGNTAVGGNLGGEGGFTNGINLGNLAVTGAQAFGTGGLSLVQNAGSVKAILHAEANKGNVDVVSSPSLMVLNNQEAKINVGDQVPIQTATSQLPTSTGTSAGLLTSNSIQYMDTGVTLEVTPRVNANGMVIMEIKQTVSTAVETKTGVTTSPTIQKKEIESSVAVLDGETIALGGLIDEKNTENKNGIPWLYQLPLIGPLFGSTTYDKTKNELVILITPRVVKSKQDSRVISDEFKRKLTGIYQEVPVAIDGTSVN